MLCSKAENDHKACPLSLVICAEIGPDSVVRAKTAEAVSLAIKMFEAMDFSLALEAALSISGTANRHMGSVEPWSLLKKVSLQQNSILVFFFQFWQRSKPGCSKPWYL